MCAVRIASRLTQRGRFGDDGVQNAHSSRSFDALHHRHTIRIQDMVVMAFALADDNHPIFGGD